MDEGFKESILALAIGLVKFTAFFIDAFDYLEPIFARKFRLNL